MRILIFLIMLVLTDMNAQENRLKWYKGNTHTHSYWSDGNDFPEMVMDWYKTNGYHFVSLSEHNILADHQKWKKISTDPLHQELFKRYFDKYGDDWVNFKKNNNGEYLVKLKTIEEYRPLFEEKGKFLIMKAQEVTDIFEGRKVHMGAINIKELVEPQGGNSVANVLQNNLNAIYEQRKKTGQPMFAHINHPNFQWAVKVEDMIDLKNNRFFEVHNSHPKVNNYGNAKTPGMEEIWDILLINYIKDNKPLLYGLATDDSHDYFENKKDARNPGRGWIMVRAAELTPKALIEAMERGDFYSTTGVELEEINSKNNELEVFVKTEEGIAYTIQFWGAKNNLSTDENKGILFKEVKGNKAKYSLKEDDLYVRAKVISSKIKENPYKEGDFETAWIQPISRATSNELEE